MDKIREKWASLSAKTKLIVQIVLGLLLSAGSGFFLYSSSNGKDNFLSLALALAFALIVPNILERQLETQMPYLKRTIIIGLLVFILLSFIMALVSKRSA